MRADEIARALGGGRKCGAGYLARCPAHADRTPSLSLRDAEEELVSVQFHAGCTQQEVIDALRARGLWERRRHPDGGFSEQTTRRAQPPSAPENETQRYERAMRIWEATRPIQGTLGETYLRSRGLTIASDRL